MMNIIEALYYLDRHNEWRRGSEIEQLKPSVIGESIDSVIEWVKKGLGLSPFDGIVEKKNLEPLVDHNFVQTLPPIEILLAKLKPIKEKQQEEKEMEKRAINITIEQAKELYNANNKFRGTLLSVFTDIELGIDNRPKSFAALGKVEGYYATGLGGVFKLENLKENKQSKNAFPSILDAKKALAEAQLRQLAKKLNDDELEEDWVDWGLDILKHFTSYKRFHLESLQTIGLNGGDIYFKRQDDLVFSLKHHKELWLDYFKIER